MSPVARSRALLAATTAALGLIAAPAAALADSGATTPREGYTLDRLDAVVASGDLAGYAGAGGNGGASVVFTVPIPLGGTCPDFGDASLYSSLTPYETGPDYELVNGGGGVITRCQDGVASWTGVLYDPYGVQLQTGDDVWPGDTIRVTYVSDEAANQSYTEYENLTTGAVVSTPVFPWFPTTELTTGDQLELGLPRPGPFDIDKHKFSAVTVDGSTLQKGQFKRSTLNSPVDEVTVRASRIKHGAFNVRAV